MPHVRSETARRLADEGFKQARIAEHLGVSQAMVSKYLRQHVRAPPGVPAAALQSIVDRSVATVLDEERAGRLAAWCPVCPQMAPRTDVKAPQLVDECLRGERPTERDQAEQVLENLRAATARLERLSFARLAPAVNVNLAMAIPDARDARGVASIPGRLVEVRGRLRAVAAPEFGASRHLSQLLLDVRRQTPDRGAVACLRDGDDVRRAVKAAGLRSKVLQRSRGEVRLPGPFAEDALIDPGDFGIEPITYLFGTTALDVVEKAERILQNLPSPVNA